MSLHQFQEAKRLHDSDAGFYALIMAAMWKADTDNQTKLREAWPEVWEDLQARYDAPGALLPHERETL